MGKVTDAEFTVVTPATDEVLVERDTRPFWKRYKLTLALDWRIILMSGAIAASSAAHHLAESRHLLQ